MTYIVVLQVARAVVADKSFVRVSRTLVDEVFNTTVVVEGLEEQGQPVVQSP